MAWTGRIDDSGPVLPAAGLPERDAEGDSEQMRRIAGLPRNPVDMALVLCIVLLLVGAVAVAVNLWQQI
jgi:hypothetical protein